MLLLLALPACSPVWKTGHDLAEARRYYEASDYWLSVLDDPEQKHAPAKRGLKHYGEQAAEQLLGDAHDHAADDEHDASVKDEDVVPDEAYGTPFAADDSEPVDLPRGSMFCEQCRRYARLFESQMQCQQCVWRRLCVPGWVPHEHHESRHHSRFWWR